MLMKSSVKRFAEKHINLNHKSILGNFSNVKDIQVKNHKLSSVINLTLVNDIADLNTFFYSVNHLLEKEGKFLGRLKTNSSRRKYILQKYPPLINIIIYVLDYSFNRVIPKLQITKRLYKYFTKGKGKVISRAELYGRLYYLGFEIIKTFISPLAELHII